MVCTAFMAHDVCPLSVPAVVHRNKCLCYSAIGLYLRSLRADNVRGTARIRPPLLQRLIDIQWSIAKNGGGYTQRGVAKGLKVSCLFMITEVSIRYQKNPGGSYIRHSLYTRVYPAIHHCRYLLCSVCMSVPHSPWSHLSPATAACGGFAAGRPHQGRQRRALSSNRVAAAARRSAANASSVMFTATVED